MIQDLVPSQKRSSIIAAERLQKYVCIHHNGETYITWQKDKDAARQDCEENSREGKPWKVLAYPSWI